MRDAKPVENLSPAALTEKKCSRCGAVFGCRQAEGCWCAEVRIAPAKLAELRATFADCLCEACLRSFATEDSGAERGRA